MMRILSLGYFCSNDHISFLERTALVSRDCCVNVRLYKCCHPVPVVPWRSSDFACRLELVASRTREGGRVGISHVYPPKILCAFWVASVVFGKVARH